MIGGGTRQTTVRQLGWLLLLAVAAFPPVRAATNQTRPCCESSPCGEEPCEESLDQAEPAWLATAHRVNRRRGARCRIFVAARDDGCRCGVTARQMTSLPAHRQFRLLDGLLCSLWL